MSYTLTITLGEKPDASVLRQFRDEMIRPFWWGVGAEVKFGTDPLVCPACGEQAQHRNGCDHCGRGTDELNRMEPFDHEDWR